MSTTSIMTACFDKLLTFTYTPTPTIIWPGIATEPPDTGMWLEPGFFPSEPIDHIWADGCPERRGFFQILVFYRVRPGVGQVPPSELADAIIAHFPKGTTLGDVRVRKTAWQSPAVAWDASRSFIPVTVPFLG